MYKELELISAVFIKISNLVEIILTEMWQKILRGDLCEQRKWFIHLMNQKYSDYECAIYWVNFF